MKKYLLTGIALLFGMGLVSAANLTPAEALNRLNKTNLRYRKGASSRPANELKLRSTVNNLYIFSSGEGFLILPDDDRVPALLGYSDSGTFTLDDNPGLKYWLDYLNYQIDCLKALPEGASTAEITHRTERAPIEPLTKTEWNQEAPYNILCPKVNGEETVTGCVATAMAQVMKYHNYPAQGKGTHSYYWDAGQEELSFNYAETPFQWEEMTNRYDDTSSEASKHAVAELMLACGISVNMHYTPGESGAATSLMGEALINIFDYSPSLRMPNRSFYGYQEWEDMIYQDLAQGLPVLYSGAGTAGGHQFICDGYSSEGFFHFNWGWGGMSNGYFLVTALNPADLGVGGGAGGFNTSQIITLGVRPPKDGDKPSYLVYNTEGFFSDAKEVKAGDALRCNGLYYNYSLDKLPADARLGMKFTSEDGSIVKYVEGPEMADMPMYYGRRDDEVIFPELSDGTYRITPTLHVDGHWDVVRMPVGYPAYITATVTDNVAELVSETGATVTITNIDVPGVIYRDHEFPMPFSVENTSDLEFYGTVTPCLVNADGNLVSKSKFRPLDLEAGESRRIADYVADFSAEEGAELPAGDYTLLFIDEAGKEVSDPVQVKLEVLDAATEIKVEGLTLDNGDRLAETSDVKFSFKVTCTSGLFYGNVRVVIFPGDGGYDVYSKSSDAVYLSEGEHKYLSITTNLDELKDGTYIASIYHGDTMMTEEKYFTIDRITSGVDGLPSDNLSEKSRIYNLDGVPQKEALDPGLYIINGKVTLIK